MFVKKLPTKISFEVNLTNNNKNQSCMIFETYECFVIKESPFLDFCSSDFDDSVISVLILLYISQKFCYNSAFKFHCDPKFMHTSDLIW